MFSLILVALSLCAITLNCANLRFIELLAVSAVSPAYAIYLLAGVVFRFPVQLGIVRISPVYYCGFTPQAVIVLGVVCLIAIMQLAVLSVC